jgi:hypothetical protein
MNWAAHIERDVAEFPGSSINCANTNAAEASAESATSG